MKKILFSLLTVVLLVGCSHNGESEYCTFTLIVQYDSISGWYNYDNPISIDSIIDSTSAKVEIVDGIVMKPKEHPEFNCMIATAHDGKSKIARRVRDGFKAFAECKTAAIIGMCNSNTPWVYSDDINFANTSDIPNKGDSSYYKYAKLVQVRLRLDKDLFDGIDDEMLKEEEPRLLNESGNDFLILGEPSRNGKDAIIRVLEDYGFTQDGEVEECDLTAIGKSLTYNVVYKCFDLDDDQIRRLSGGIFDGLDSFSYSSGSRYCYVFLEWFKSGIVKKATISICGGLDELSEDDAIKVNKRLFEMFGKSKISNKRYGYMTYYNDNGIECYYPNNLQLHFEMK